MSNLDQLDLFRSYEKLLVNLYNFISYKRMYKLNF